MTILVIGMGFVGLTAALGFAEKGFSVFGYDIDPKRSETIRSGHVPFLEPELQEALERHLNERFEVLAGIEDLPTEPDCVFFCVGTPCDETGAADLLYLNDAASAVSSKCSASLFVVKSTIPPGTTERVFLPRLRAAGITNSVVVNPEFLREGKCWSDFIHPDRIVCGLEAGDTRAEKMLSAIYAPFYAPLHFISRSTAEFIKYLSNCFFANQISFSNEMALVAEAVGSIDVGTAFRILHEDSRLDGAGVCHYLYPGCGYGGYCLPKDTMAMLQNARSNGYEPSILAATVRLNESMPRLSAEKILRRMKNLDETIGILGLSFKPDSDDVRDSSAAKIIAELVEAGCRNIRAYDPVANENFACSYRLPVRYCNSAEELCESCRTVALVTAWTEFADMNKRYPAVNWIDCRYFFDGMGRIP